MDYSSQLSTPPHRVQLTDATCDSAVIQLQLSMALSLDQVVGFGGIEAFVGKTHDKMFKSYGEDRLCLEDAFHSTLVDVGMILVGPTRR